jgi:hypothetical protein
VPTLLNLFDILIPNALNLQRKHHTCNAMDDIFMAKFILFCFQNDGEFVLSSSSLKLVDVHFNERKLFCEDGFQCIKRYLENPNEKIMEVLFPMIDTAFVENLPGRPIAKRIVDLAPFLALTIARRTKALASFGISIYRYLYMLDQARETQKR